MTLRVNPADALLALTRVTDSGERLASWRQAVTALGQTVRIVGPPPLDGVNQGQLAHAVGTALETGLVDQLDFIAPGPAAVALYELMMALPSGPQRRDIGRRVLTHIYEGTASTFAGVGTRMALGSGRALEPATMQARVGLVFDLPVGATIDADALALSLVTRRDLNERWLARPSVGALPARRLAAKLLEHAAREAVMRAQNGDSLPRDLLGGEIVRPVRRRLLADREPLVWRHAAVSRGLLAAVDPRLREQIDLALDPELTPTEWRRAAVSLVATMVGDPKGGLESCVRLLKSEILKRDPGITATMLWGLPRVMEAEPDAAEELLDEISLSRRPDVAEALAALLSDCIFPEFGMDAVRTLRAVLASKLDAEPPVLKSITRRTLAALDREGGEDPLGEALKTALVAYESEGARPAHEAAVEALAYCQRRMKRLRELDLREESSLAEALSSLADVDATALERNRLYDLLLLGHRPGESVATVVELDQLYESLGNWLLDAEERELSAEWSRIGSLGNQRRLRALLHLVDVETARGEGDESGSRVRGRVRRALDVLLRRLEAGPDGAVHRIVCANLARACDAAAREGVAEACDVFLLVARHVGDRHSLVALSEASAAEDVHTVLLAYSEFLDPGSGEPASRADSTLDTETHSLSNPHQAMDASRRVVRLSQGLAAGGSHRAEALRSTVLRLGRALETCSVARGLNELFDAAAGSSAVGDVEEAADALRVLGRSAQRRVLGKEPRAPALVVSELPSLSVLVERAVSTSTSPPRQDVETAVEEVMRSLPTPIAQAISVVLSRIAELPIEAPTDVVAIPLGRRRVQLPDWLLPRRTIGAFYVVRPLGAGGVSSVFVARRLEERHDSKAESFALKVPQYDPTTARSLSEQEFLQMFTEEAGALLSLPHHPNLSRFVTFDLAARPKPILVMELIRGVGLDRLIRSRSLATPRAFEYLDGILAALEAMHGVGVGHLDIKPSNIILRDGQTPVLVDFGLSGRKLRPGCGSLEYCAPEVIGVVPKGHVPSPLAADIYAFACMTFELMTGEPLFIDGDETALVSAHISHDGWPARLTELARKDGLEDMGVLLAACLRRDPRARPTVNELRIQLARVARKLEKKAWPIGSAAEERAASS
jgi:hypothetical protein